MIILFEEEQVKASSQETFVINKSQPQFGIRRA